MTTDYFVYCKGWDYEHNEEIDCYDGPFQSKQDAFDFIDWCAATQHDPNSKVSIHKTSEPVVLT